VPEQPPAGQWHIHKQVVVQNIFVGQIQVVAVYERHIQVVVAVYEGHIQVVVAVYEGYIQVVAVYKGHIQVAVVYKSYNMHTDQHIFVEVETAGAL